MDKHLEELTPNDVLAYIKELEARLAEAEKQVGALLRAATVRENYSKTMEEKIRVAVEALECGDKMFAGVVKFKEALEKIKGQG